MQSLILQELIHYATWHWNFQLNVEHFSLYAVSKSQQRLWFMIMIYGLNALCTFLSSNQIVVSALLTAWTGGLCQQALWHFNVQTGIELNLQSIARFIFYVKVIQAISLQISSLSVSMHCVNYAINSFTFSIASVVSSKMNFSVNPCDDFYQFACGRFEKTSIIPDDAGSVNTINMIEGRVMAQLHTLMNSEIQEHEIRPFKMVKQMFRQCMNTGKFIAIIFFTPMSHESLINCSPNREERGGVCETKAQLALKVARVAGARNLGWIILEFVRLSSIQHWIFYRLRSEEDFTPAYLRKFFSFWAESSFQFWLIQQISAANLGLGRDMLLHGFDDNVIKAYHRYMVDISVYFGANRTNAENAYARVLLFEMMLANVSWSRIWFGFFLCIYLVPVTIAFLFATYWSTIQKILIWYFNFEFDEKFKIFLLIIELFVKKNLLEV